MRILFGAVVNAEQFFPAGTHALRDESDKDKIDQVKSAGQGASPSPSVPEGPNAIARDRIESPQDH